MVTFSIFVIGLCLSDLAKGVTNHVWRRRYDP